MINIYLGIKLNPNKMPGSREIVELKKKIHHLQEHNTELKELNQEYSEKIGELEQQLLQLRNKEMYLQMSKINQTKEQLREGLKKDFKDEMTKKTEVNKENLELKQQIEDLKVQLKNRDKHIQDLQMEMKNGNQQLLEFTEKNQAEHFIQELNIQRDTIAKKEEDQRKQLTAYNELCQKMDKVLYENRVLRQIADVPDNFGIDIQAIKMQDHVKIEDYKAKIRHLKNEVSNLEEERAVLKHRLLMCAGSLEGQKEPFSLLTAEQKVDVLNYANDLVEGKKEMSKTQYDLIKENERLQREIAEMKPSYGETILKGKTGGTTLRSQPKTAMQNDEIEELKKGQEEILNMIKSGGGFNKNMGGSYIGYGKPDTEVNTFNVMGNTQGMVPYLDLGLTQLPAIPFRDFTGAVHAGSYRFNCLVKVDKDKIHKIYGVCEDEDDCEKLKMESAALQSQILELLEVESRRNKNDTLLNDNLQNIFNKYQRCCQKQNEVFFRYMQAKENMKKDTENFNRRNKDLETELEILKTQNNTYLNAINQLKSNDPNGYIDKVQQIAILQAKLIKEKRKFDCLFEEEGKLNERMKQKEEAEIEKDKLFKDNIARLKKWKALLTFYLKLIMKKLRNSVDKKEFDRLLGENKFLREKSNELMMQDLSLTKLKCQYDELKSAYKRLENDFYETDELRLDSECDLNYLRMRIYELDPQYKIQEDAFKRIANKIKELKLTYQQLKGILCKGVVKQNPKEESKIADAKRTQNILEGLTIDNTLITKNEFKEGLKELGVLGGKIKENDLKLTYMYLNCDDSNNIDVRGFLKKLEQLSAAEAKSIEKDKDVLLRLIRCVRDSGQNILSTFEFFDTNNNGYITREEFKFALSQLKFEVNEESINKLIYLVTEDSIENFVLDKTDTFNYREFCALFEQKAQNILLKKRKEESANKLQFNIDWKTNILNDIYESLLRNEGENMNLKSVLDEYFEHNTDLNKDQFVNYLGKIVGKTRQEKERLFYELDPSNSGSVRLDDFVRELEKTQAEVRGYKEALSENFKKSEESIAKKLYTVTEEKNFLNYKVEQLTKKILALEAEVSDTDKELTKYRTNNDKLFKKYFDNANQLQEYKEKYVDKGITRSEVSRIEEQNEDLIREVTILRIGLNTFKELYNAANHQNKYMHVNNCINSEELVTYKKAVKELQSENNQNALIGKLYYTILISRWREANVSRKFDEFSLNFNSLKEDNIQMQIQNEGLTKDLAEITESYQEKLIENLVINDQLENYKNGFMYSGSKDYFHPFNDMKKIIKNLTKEKIQQDEDMLKLKKDNLILENERNELRSHIAYANKLEENIKFENNDEYSKKLIKLCDEVSQLKLSDNQNRREKEFNRENAEHLEKMKQQLQKEVDSLEQQNNEIENKLRKIEEVFKARDDERQRKIIDALEKMKVYSREEIYNILNGGDHYTQPGNTNINYKFDNSPEGQMYKTTENIPLNQSGSRSNYSQSQNVVRSTRPNKDKVFDKEEQKANRAARNQELLKLPKNEIISQLNKLEQKLESQNTIIELKDKQIKNLQKDNYEIKSLMDKAKFDEENSVPNLVGNTGYKKLRDDDTQLVAETAQKTVKTLQDMINQKNNLIVLKDNQINKLNEENHQMKVNYLKQIATLQDQIKNDHDSTMKKLGNIIDNTNPNLVAKMNRNDLSLLTLNDLEKMINEKDNAIKALATELKVNQEEKDTIYFELQEKNKKILTLEDEVKLQKLRSKNVQSNSEIDKLKKTYEEKLKELQRERDELEKTKYEYASKYDTNAFRDANLDNTSYVPERLIINKEKSDLYVKIDQLRRKNTKLNEEKKALTEKIGKLEEEKRRVDDKLAKAVDDNRIFIEGQVRDNKKSSKLSKENEKLKKENENLTKENQNLKEKLKSNEDKGLQSSQIKKSGNKGSTGKSYNPSANIPDQQFSGEMVYSQKKPDFNMSSSIKPNEPNISQSMYGTGQNKSGSIKGNKSSYMSQDRKKSDKPIEQEKLERLVYLCLEKRINLSDQLKRYDLGGSGKISPAEFRNSIEELKLGFIDRDYDALEKCAQISGGTISIHNFIELAKKVDPNYKEFLESQENKRNADPTLSKKYVPFDNKSYNINY
ncbi:MAG: EF-hand domain-containing protein [archaeon]|nr:EF-hand domain-containing protein [archaeon]